VTNCPLCKCEIENGTVFCTSCQNFTDWRRHLSGVEKALALLVALVSVIGLNLSNAFDYFDPPRAEVFAIADPMSDTEMKVDFTNVGSVAGYVAYEVNCGSGNDSHDFRVEFLAETPAVVLPSASSTAFFRLSAFDGANRVSGLAELLDGAVLKGAHTEGSLVLYCYANGFDEHGMIDVIFMRPTLEVRRVDGKPEFRFVSILPMLDDDPRLIEFSRGFEEAWQQNRMQDIEK
jgi:hypothetical protein